ncbi:MAG: acyl-phosphate glycerol 3-phosphate acyltransferase [Bacteroidetes bacterium RIFCSPLOWO2_02_FULL_36_8]|nr:MAG: acyl-phosphate glycerol 3-phosphate acyltransferase [Bacteroidetes bacterium RIFCSPLOWO2_02_FULL_36_8]OFY70368.1 MAG: acyl-phosphate glycerol 3-phosphate acyltransferase [Bacteroidetes bacterium RIFCSPLOWO2_12_FULL_37_12]
MDYLYITLSVIAAYLLGSIPPAVWIGRFLYDIDVREYGSGNAGATNTFRILGKRPGIMVMIIDIFKGFFAAYLIVFLLEFVTISENNVIYYKLLFGIAAVTGHIYPVFAGFRGGKGVATLLGVAFAIHLEASLICMGVFLSVMFISKYVSLSSIIASLTFPLLFLFPHFRAGSPVLIIFGLVISAIVILTHQKNIQRLLKGEERKVDIRIRRKKQVDDDE